MGRGRIREPCSGSKIEEGVEDCSQRKAIECAWCTRKMLRKPVWSERLTGEKVREGSGGERKKEAFAGSPALTLSETGNHWKIWVEKEHNLIYTWKVLTVYCTETRLQTGARGGLRSSVTVIIQGGNRQQSVSGKGKVWSNSRYILEILKLVSTGLDAEHDRKWLQGFGTWADGRIGIIKNCEEESWGIEWRSDISCWGQKVRREKAGWLIYCLGVVSILTVFKCIGLGEIT